MSDLKEKLKKTNIFRKNRLNKKKNNIYLNFVSFVNFNCGRIVNIVLIC